MLTKQQLSHFRGMLEAERKETQAKIDAWRQDIGDPNYGETAGVDDLGDESTRIFQKESELENIQRAQSRLRQIEHALARMEVGIYGVSEVSGQPIPVERLEAIPWTTVLVGEKLPES
jgi:RNA polymerase-binding transcription factor DksA